MKKIHKINYNYIYNKLKECKKYILIHYQKYYKNYH